MRPPAPRKAKTMMINDNEMGRDDLRKGRGDHAKEDHHVEADEALGGEHHRVELSISKGHIPAVQLKCDKKSKFNEQLKMASTLT